MESKVKPNLLLVVVKYGLDVVWYLSFVLIIFGIVFLITKKDNPNTNTYFSIDVKYSGELRPSYTSRCESITSVEFEPTHGKLLMKGKLPLANMMLLYISSIALFALYFVFLFYLRKLFSSFMRQSPFCMENVKRIRALSYCFAVFNILILAWEKQFIYQITNLTSYPEIYTTSIPGDYVYIFIAIIIYVFADVFKYGVQIQEENNKFV